MRRARFAPQKNGRVSDIISSHQSRVNQHHHHYHHHYLSTQAKQSLAMVSLYVVRLSLSQVLFQSTPSYLLEEYYSDAPSSLALGQRFKFVRSFVRSVVRLFVRFLAIDHLTKLLACHDAYLGIPPCLPTSLRPSSCDDDETVRSDLTHPAAALGRLNE